MLPSPITFLIALIILVLAGRFVIKYITAAAKAFGVSEFITAFVLLAIATSMPELFISISSAVMGAGDLVMAVVLGSNVINATLVIGLVAFLSLGISTSTLNLRRDIIIGSTITILPIIFALDGKLSYYEGFALVSAFTYYMYLLYQTHIKESNGTLFPHIAQGLLSSALVVAFLSILIYSAGIVVESAIDLARIFSLPQSIIGVLLIAMGTSLPEITLAIQASLRRKPGLALGNVIGTNITNSGLVVGLAAVARPLSININTPFITTSTFVVISILMLGSFAISKKRFSVREGLTLLSLFVFFIITTLLAGLYTA
jgi:cation:H+ antiporter